MGRDNDHNSGGKRRASIMDKFKLDSMCAKCGTTSGASVVYKSKVVYPTDVEYQADGVMLRTCRVCGYGWYEFPLDAKEVDGGQV